MPRDVPPRGRHRRSGGWIGRINSISHTALAILVLGVAIVLLGGGWVWVAQLLKPQAVIGVPVIPTESFEPAAPSLALTPSPSDDKNCPDFFDQDDAQKYFVAQGGPTIDPDKLDLDKDGLACENYPYPTSTPSPVPIPESTVSDVVS